MYAASDASGKLGYGVVEWTDESICHEVEKRMWKTLPPLQPMHIFLKEFYAVVRAVETLTAKHRGKLIVLAVDNTAVIGALRAMYSSNKHACDYIKRIDEQLLKTGSQLRIVPVQSLDNAADCSSRNKRVSATVAEKCLAIMKNHEYGAGRYGQKTSQSIRFTGKLRHADADDDVEEPIELLECDGLTDVYELSE